MEKHSILEIITMIFGAVLHANLGTCGTIDLWKDEYIFLDDNNLITVRESKNKAFLHIVWQVPQKDPYGRTTIEWVDDHVLTVKRNAELTEIMDAMDCDEDCIWFGY